MGTTIMSPKETYIINTEGLGYCENGVVGTSGKSLRRIMQFLFIDSFLNNLPSSLVFSNCYILLNVEKSSVLAAPSSFFVPRQRFHVPSRGLKFTLNLSTREGGSDLESGNLYMAAPRPFRGAKSFTGNTPCASKESGLSRPLDFLDTIGS